jgi:hypothetical protein
MRICELGLLYLLFGLGCGVVAIVRPVTPSSRIADALLLVPLWPLYGPFMLNRAALQQHERWAPGEVTFLAALRKASGTPLASLLPDAQTARELARRLRVAEAKIVEIDDLLLRPEFDERMALQRHQELRDRGASECARSTAGIRIQNIRRLRALRDRFSRELDEVGELVAQLTTQAEVLRLAGGTSVETRTLVQELLSRVEGLDQMLDDGPVMPAGSLEA